MSKLILTIALSLSLASFYACTSETPESTPPAAESIEATDATPSASAEETTAPEATEASDPASPSILPIEDIEVEVKEVTVSQDTTIVELQVKQASD